MCLFYSLYHFLSLAVNHCHLLSLVVICCYSLCHLLSLAVIHCHLLSLVVIRCHSLSLVVPLVFIRCTTRCHSLSLVLPLVCLFIKDHFMPTISFENLWFSDVFRGYQKGLVKLKNDLLLSFNFFTFF